MQRLLLPRILAVFSLLSVGCISAGACAGELTSLGPVIKDVRPKLVDPAIQPIADPSGGGGFDQTGQAKTVKATHEAPRSLPRANQLRIPSPHGYFHHVHSWNTYTSVSLDSLSFRPDKTAAHKSTCVAQGRGGCKDRSTSDRISLHTIGLWGSPPPREGLFSAEDNGGIFSVALELGEDLNPREADSQPASDTSAESSVDPTDPTAIRFQVNTSFEWENLNGNQGNTYGLFVVEPWIPLSAQDLLTIEIRLASSALDDQPIFVGMGDTRIRYFHLMPIKDGGILKALAPSLDMFLPTGDESKGLGGGSWIFAPNLVLALQLTDSITAYPFFRYVQSIRAVDPATAPDGGFPGEDEDDDERQDTTISGFNFEMPITFQLADAWWFTVNPNFFKNFAGNQASSFSSKFSVTTMIGDSVSPTIEISVPIAGSNSFDFALKGSVTFFF